MDLQQLAAAMEPIVRSAGAYIKTAVPEKTEEKKNHSDLVTEFDVNTQRMLTEKLHALHPAAKFMGEEEHLEADISTGDCFVIDPIDGTTNFVKGFGRSCVSVALLRNGEQAVGIVYNPWSEEYYCAVKGKGATMNGTPLRVLPTALEDCVVGMGTCPYYPDLARRSARIIGEIMTVAMDIRRMGSAALDLCDIAMNRTGAFFELLLSPWDYAAAGLILTEAGGVITDTDGNPVSLQTPSPIVAGTPQAQAELRKLIAKTKRETAMKLHEINIRDPFILPCDGKYYLYGSRVGTPSEEYYYGKQFGFDVYVSNDLEDWSEPKSIFEITPDFWGERDSWAPEVHRYNGKFYLFASFFAKDRRRGTHIFVCDTPDGTFVPLSPDPATPADWECLDGTFYVDQAGTPYMVFCHEWLQIGDGTVCAVELSKDLSAPVGEPKFLWKASDYKDAHGLRGGANYVTDGPFLYRNRNGDLLAIWSSFNDNGYVELISKSDNGEIDGAWTVLDAPLSAEDGGHGMIFAAFDGKEYFIMHRPNRTTAERPVITELKHDGERIFI